MRALRHFFSVPYAVGVLCSSKSTPVFPLALFELSPEFSDQPASPQFFAEQNPDERDQDKENHDAFPAEGREDFRRLADGPELLARERRTEPERDMDKHDICNNREPTHEK